MIDLGKRNVLGVGVDAVDYEAAVARVIDAARRCRPLSATAIAVHGIMSGVLDPVHRRRLNRVDLVVPDGQPVRWALNLLHGTQLSDRVYGPTLMLRLCERAAAEAIPVFLFGSRDSVLEELEHRLRFLMPELRIAGRMPSLFRPPTAEEFTAQAATIRASGARLVFVGLGCPRQEIWSYEQRDSIGFPLVAVGAAFDFHAGGVPQAPPWMQRAGLEWLFRLRLEPLRLWRRYLLLNPIFLALLTLQWVGLRRPSAARDPEPNQGPTWG